MIIQIKDYPYGKITNTLRLAVKYVNLNNIKEFEYPYYGGIDQKIIDKLSPDEVDFIQENL